VNEAKAVVAPIAARRDEVVAAMPTLVETDATSAFVTYGNGGAHATPRQAGKLRSHRDDDAPTRPGGGSLDPVACGYHERRMSIMLLSGSYGAPDSILIESR